MRLPAAAIRSVRSHVGMVFQQFNLWPHMTALGNVAEALVRGPPPVPQGGRGARPGRARARSASPTAPATTRPALRRPAAARRHRPRAGAGAADPALRRADRLARPRADRRGPERDARRSPAPASPCWSSPTRSASPPRSPRRSSSSTTAGAGRRAAVEGLRQAPPRPHRPVPRDLPRPRRGDPALSQDVWMHSRCVGEILLRAMRDRAERISEWAAGQGFTGTLLGLESGWKVAGKWLATS